MTTQSQTFNEQCLPNIRWLHRRDVPATLQQCWQVIEYRDGEPYGSRLVWLDVPIVWEGV